MRNDYPGRAVAERILTEAEPLNPGPWVAHSQNAAYCAEAIASRSGMDPEKAYVLGLLHDIGRRAGIGQLKHVYFGWKDMNDLGYPDVARVCLTHSYNAHCFSDDLAICDITPEQTDELRKALDTCVYDDYDRLIQLCDSIADANGVVDNQERMTDIKNRYSSYSQAKWDKNLELLEYFQNKVGCDIYTLCRNWRKNAMPGHDGDLKGTQNEA